MKIKNPKFAFEECPRVNFCNINKCILHPDFKKLENDESDPAFSSYPNQKCIPKSIRVRIAKKWNLANGGITEKEKIAKERWDSLPEEVKRERISKLQKKKPKYPTKIEENGEYTDKTKTTLRTPTNQGKIARNHSYEGYLDFEGDDKNE